jgi:hypothetical protein
LEPPRGGRRVVAPSTGSVVLVPFPFSDLSQAKLRPAVVLASGDRNDWVLCQVTSNGAFGSPRQSGFICLHKDWGRQVSAVSELWSGRFIHWRGKTHRRVRNSWSLSGPFWNLSPSGTRPDPSARLRSAEGAQGRPHRQQSLGSATQVTC